MKPIINRIPTEPGVYRFFNADKEIIYIGKAINLRNRVRSYWAKHTGLSPAKQQMVGEIENIDYIAVHTEQESLLLEATLIKKHQPKYNIDLRDDKNWTYIVITKTNPPRIVAVHGDRKLKGEYFGPYTSGSSARTVVRLLYKLFPLPGEGREYSSVTHDLNRLYELLGTSDVQKPHAPIKLENFINEARKILKGNINELRGRLQTAMKDSSARQEYERAAVLRNKLEALERIRKPQDVVHPLYEDHDIVGVAHADTRAVVTILRIREGRMLDPFHYTITNNLELQTPELLEQFLMQYYTRIYDAPDIVLLPSLPSRAVVRVLRPLRLKIPERGSKKRLLDLASKNAWIHLKATTKDFLPPALYELKRILKLPEIPLRIEAYDISNIQGNYAVGAMVVAINGSLAKSEYRKFKIKTVRGSNDVAMLREVVARRLRHPEWAEPQLIILDGGKAQLSTVYPILPPAWRGKVIALAKREEEIFLPRMHKPLVLPHSNEGLKLLMAVRDAVHGFAIRYYRKRHGKAALEH